MTPFLILPDTHQNESQHQNEFNFNSGSYFQSVIYPFEKVSTSNGTIEIMFAKQVNQAKIYQVA